MDHTERMRVFSALEYLSSLDQAGLFEISSLIFHYYSCNILNYYLNCCYLLVFQASRIFVLLSCYHVEC